MPNNSLQLMPRNSCRTAMRWWAGWLLSVSVVAIAQANDDENAAAVMIRVREFWITEEAFDEIVFGVQQPVLIANGFEQTAEQGFRRRMDALATVEIHIVDRHVSLTEAQKKKLRLAARGDVSRHVDRAAELRRKLTTKGLTQEQYVALERDVLLLSWARNFGVFGDQSLFRKTLHGMLTEEQQVGLQSLQREERATIVEKALLNCEQTASRFVLTGETRRKFIELLVEHGRVPQNVGQYGQSIVLLEANRLRDRVKQLLTEAEWEKFEWQVGLAKRMEPTIEGLGLWTARHPDLNEENVKDDTKD